MKKKIHVGDFLVPFKSLCPNVMMQEHKNKIIHKEVTRVSKTI